MADQCVDIHSAGALCAVFGSCSRKFYGNAAGRAQYCWLVTIRGLAIGLTIWFAAVAVFGAIATETHLSLPSALEILMMKKSTGTVTLIKEGGGLEDPEGELDDEGVAPLKSDRSRARPPARSAHHSPWRRGGVLHHRHPGRRDLASFHYTCRTLDSQIKFEDSLPAGAHGRELQAAQH